jgi:hypothetical protein
MPLMVAVAVPVLVSVTCCEVLLPTAIEPKFRIVGEALSVAEVPVPDAVITVGEFVALLAIEIVAESAAALCGANVTVAMAVAPGAIVEPLAIPVTE